MHILFAIPADLDKAAALLRAGGTVAMPTETVYGLAADARNPQALAAIFRAKGRPVDHPLIVHISHLNELAEWATDIPELAWTLAKTFWPGPLTLVLPRKPGVSDLVTGGQHTVAVRMPAHPAALALLQAFGGALCAPSANRFGRISPTQVAHVVTELHGRIDAVLDGGDCTLGIESTIVDLSGAQPQILRPGHIAAEALAAVIGYPVPVLTRAVKVRAPGLLDSHYAPETPAYLVPASQLTELARRWPSRCFVLATTLPPEASGLQMPAQPQDYARVLYQSLRIADHAQRDCILVAEPPASPAWLAVRDRLQRACSRLPVNECGCATDSSTFI